MTTNDNGTTDPSANASGEGEHSDRTASGGASRRTFLKATAGAGALAAGLGAGMVGSAAAEGINTPWLSVDGNVLTDPSGNTVKLRGVNIADPKRLNVTAPARGKNAEQVLDMITDGSAGWYPRVIRIPNQPVDIGENTPGHIDGAPEPPAYEPSQLETYLDEHVDPLVDMCEQKGVYCIIDMHRHWKPLQWASGVPTAQDDPKEMINQALHDEVMTFWETVAPRYADRSHVIYEIYNEPTEPGMWADVIERDWCKYVWDTWMAMAQPWVDEIRSVADNHIIVGNPGWSTSPEGALYKPFEGGNLSYAYHIYPGHNPSMNQNWDSTATNAQGVAAGGTSTYEKYPLFVTEFGWDSTIISNYLRGKTSDFGEPFMEFLESSPALNWTAWCADPIWLPKMFQLGDWAGENGFGDSVGHPYEDEIPQLCDELPCSWELMTGENMGGFIKQQLADKRDDLVPQVEDGGPTNPSTPTDEPESDVEPVMEGQMPADMDADGHYEDINGDGEVDFNDLVGYYQHRNDPVMTDHMDAYDYTGDGELDFNDLVALYQEMN